MNDLQIRPYRPEDESQVVRLWLECNLIVPLNNPYRDIQRKLRVNPEWFLVGIIDGTLASTCMVGYEGRRGWINFLGVLPRYRRRGIATRMMREAESILKAAGCAKVNLQVREYNKEAVKFYESVGYRLDPVLSLGKRLEHDEPFSADGGTASGADEPEP